MNSSEEITPERLRELTNGASALKRRLELAEIRERMDDAEKAKKDTEDAQKIIKRSPTILEKAASEGESGCIIAHLRGGIHFEERFQEIQDPRFLGTFGKVLYEYFTSKRFEVSFNYWIDPMRCMELPEDTGYEMIVSW